MSGDQWVNGGCRSVSSARKPDPIVAWSRSSSHRASQGAETRACRRESLTAIRAVSCSRLGERDAADLAQRVLGDEKVPALNRSSKDRPWMYLRGRACLS
jgi:hypothetical protein